MTTDLVRQDSYSRATLDEKRRYVDAIAQAGDLLPSSLWTKPVMVNGQMQPARPSPGKVLMLAETGAMLGLHPMAALTGIHIIEGKPTLSANLLGGLVRRAGHKLRVTTTGDWDAGTFVARAELTRADDPDFVFVVEWTPVRAKRAGLTGKGNWAKYPEAMAKARAITEVIREGSPDVTLSASYSPEELGAEVQGEEGEPIILQEQPRQAEPQSASEPVEFREPEPEVRAERVAEPVKDEPTQPVDDYDWGAAIRKLEDREQTLILYRRAAEMGLLKLEVKQGRKKRELGEVLVEIGKAFAEAEAAAPTEDVVEATIEPDEGEPMALGDDS